MDLDLIREKNWAKNSFWTPFVRADLIWMQQRLVPSLLNTPAENENANEIP